MPCPIWTSPGPTAVSPLQTRKEEQMLKRRNVSIDVEPTPLSEVNQQPPANLTIPAIVEVTVAVGHDSHCPVPPLLLDCRMSSVLTFRSRPLGFRWRGGAPFLPPPPECIQMYLFSLQTAPLKSSQSTPGRSDTVSDHTQWQHTIP